MVEYQVVQKSKAMRQREWTGGAGLQWEFDPNRVNEWMTQVTLTSERQSFTLGTSDVKAFEQSLGSWKLRPQMWSFGVESTGAFNKVRHAIKKLNLPYREMTLFAGIPGSDRRESGDANKQLGMRTPWYVVVIVRKGALTGWSRHLASCWLNVGDEWQVEDKQITVSLMEQSEDNFLQLEREPVPGLSRCG